MAALRGSGLRGEAQVLLRGKPFRFMLDDRLLALLEGEEVGIAPPDGALGPQFDSSLEQRLHEEFTALERMGATHGWQMEREPEPILCAGTILIPDFALTRSGRRVYLEVAGYWSPTYRERKRRKLAALAGRVALVVAAPEEARGELAGLEEAFPLLWFRGRISAQALINLLEARFDDFALRRSAVDARAVLAEVERRGIIPWGECAVVLRSYGQSEMALVAEDLAVAARASGHEAPVLLDGLGLATPGWLARVGTAVAEWVGAAGAGGLALSALAARLSDLDPALVVGVDGVAAAEGLAWATGLTVVRASLFEPYVVAAPADGAPESMVGSPAPGGVGRRRGRGRNRTG